MPIHSMIAPICENCMPKKWERGEGRVHASIITIVGTKAKIRDNRTCQQCGSRNRKKLVAHHIKKSIDHPENRYELDNLITLCKDCESCLHALEFAVTFLNDENQERSTI